MKNFLKPLILLEGFARYAERRVFVSQRLIPGVGRQNKEIWTVIYCKIF
jgi:hypothetical protein